MSKIKHSSEFMKNQKAASVLPAQSQFEALQTHKGNALFFSISDNDRFYMSAEQNENNVGWAGVDLCDGLSETLDKKAIRAKNFAVSQNAEDGIITIAVALTLEGEKSDQLYIMTDLTDKPDAEWMDPEKSEAREWTLRSYDEKEHPLPSLDIAYIHLSKTSKAGTAPQMVVGLRREQSETIQNYVVETDITKRSGVWKIFQTAEDYDNMISMHLGKPSVFRFAGMYEIYTRGDQTSLTFTPLKSIYGPPDVLKLTPPKGASALTVVPTDDEENTDLYVAANGSIHLYTPKAQINFAKGICIIDNSIIDGVDKLYAHSVEGEVVLFAKNSKGQLFYSKCKQENKENSDAWSYPVPIQKNVEQIASYLNKKTGAEEIFAHIEGQKLEHYSRDTVTTAWKNGSILLEALEDMIEFNTYTTHLIVSDENEIPIPDTKIKLTASSPCHIYVNYKYTTLGKDAPVEVTTDKQGKLTLVQKTDGLRGISFTVEHEGCDPVNIYPMNKIHQRIKDTKDLTTVKVTDEKGKASSLIPDSATQKQKDNLSKAVSQLKSINVSEKGIIHPPSDNESFSATNFWGISHKNGGIQYYEGKDAMTAFGLTANPDGTISMKTNTIELNDIVKNSIELLIGDIFNWIKHAFQDVVTHFIKVIDGVYHFFIEVGGVLYRCALKVLGDVLDAVEFVFKKILVGVEKLMQWLGFIFNWQDILKTKQLFKNVVKLAKDEILCGIDNVEDKIAEGFEKIRKHMLTSLKDVDTSNEIFKRRISNSKAVGKMSPKLKESQGSPQNHWLMHHVKSNESSALVGEPSVKDLLQKVLKTLENVGETEIEIIQNAIGEFIQTVAKDAKDLSILELVERLFSVGLEGLLNTFENLALTLFDAFKIAIEIIWAIVNGEIKIPIISRLYKDVITNGDKLTLLDMCCLMVAIPAEIGFKLLEEITSVPRIPDAVIEKTSSAGSMSELIDLLSAPAQSSANSYKANGSFSAGLSAENKEQEQITWLDYFVTGYQFGNGIMFIGVAAGDVSQYLNDQSPTPMPGTFLMKLGTALGLVQMGYSVFCFCVFVNRKLKMTPDAWFVVGGLTCIFLLLGLKSILTLLTNRIVTYLIAFISILWSLLMGGYNVFLIIDLLSKRKKYSDDEKFVLDLSIITMNMFNNFGRATSKFCLAVNKLATDIPSGNIQDIVKAFLKLGAFDAMILGDAVASITTFAKFGCYAEEMRLGYPVYSHDIITK